MYPLHRVPQFPTLTGPARLDIDRTFPGERRRQVGVLDEKTLYKPSLQTASLASFPCPSGRPWLDYLHTPAYA